MNRLLLFFTIILFSNISFSQTWGIVGSATPNSWGGPDIPMTYNVDLAIWEATVELGNGEIKFRENNDWTVNYGDNGFDGSIEINGANIPVSAGYYSVSLNLNTQTYTLEPFEFLLGGAWKIASEVGALKVGPSEGSDGWWYLNRDDDDITIRACYMDDTYVFNLDGSFQNVLGEETWLEPWQGDPAGCEAPVFPHDGSVVASYLYDEISGTLTVNGVGAYIGLPKATNDGELGNPGDAPESITYNLIFSENDNVMTLSIEVGSGVFWTYKLINQNVVSIPDTNFETYLETHTANGDVVSIGDPSSMGDGAMNHLTLKNSVESVTNLNVNDLGISSLIGIEAFTSLEILYCQRNQLTNLDVSKNSVLSILECETNQFTALDLSQNIVLKTIGCANNFLTELDVSQNLLLEAIWFTNNGITSLNVDVNTILKVYGFSDNPLTSLSIKNGNNHNIVYSDMNSLTSLSCITVDDEAANNSNLNLDPNVTISNNCRGIVTIPDPIFEQALIELELDTDDTVNGQMSQVDAENIINLEIVGKGINNLAGIEYFKNLEALFCDNNNLTELQLRNHPNLNGIFINNNPINTINLTNCPNLVWLHISQNQLADIDISNNPLLEELSIANNNLNLLDASNNPNLTFLRANGNDLYSINIENGNNLNFVSPDWWPYSFDVRFNNNLACIQVDAGLTTAIPSDWAKENTAFYSEDGCNDVVPIPDTAFEQALIDLGIDTNGNSGDVLKRDIYSITYLNLNNKTISDLSGIEYFENLNELIIYSNPITEIDLSNNTELEVLKAGANELKSLDISNNSKLRELWAWTNQLESLNTSNNPLLEELWLGQNNITALDLSNNGNLIGLEIHKNPIAKIDLSNNLNFQRLWAWETNLTGLNLSKNGALNHLRVQDNLELSYLNVSNGNNFNMDNFYVSNTPKLTCITADANVHANMTAFSDGRLNEDCGTVYIPDENFEQALIELEIDTDGLINHLISRVDAENATEIIANFPLKPDSTTNGGADPRVTITTKIKDLTGIEAFTNLEILECQGNQLEILDISKNLALTKLECGWNQISNLDVSQNSALEILGCHDNNLNSIDVSENLALTVIWCSNNNIRGLNLDVNTNLRGYGLSNNPLTYLSIKNGNNHNVTYSQIVDLPNLSCITVDDETASYLTDKSFWKAVTDAGITFSNDCGTVYIPDESFEQALIELEIDTDGIINHLISKSDAENTTEIIANFPIIQDSNGNDIVNPFADPRVTITTKIKDLTGIEAFVNLEILGASYGELATVDLLQNTKLYEVFVNGNLLSEIDVSKNTLLTRFGVTKNPNIDVLDVSNNILLEELFIDETAISSIDVSSNTNLWKFWGRWSNLTGIDLSNNTNLRDVRVIGSSNLTYLNVRNGNNLNVTGFDVRYMNNLSCLTTDDTQSQLMIGYSNGITFSPDCGTVYIPDENFEQALIDLGIDAAGIQDHIILRSEAEAVTELYVSNKNISDISGIEYFSRLKEFDCSGNQITSLNVSNNLALEKLVFDNAPISNIDVSTNLALKHLSFSNWNEVGLISEIDVTQNLALEVLWLDGNQITSLDVTKNAALKELWCHNSQITTLNLSSNPALSWLYINNSLALERLEMDNTSIDVIDVSTNLALKHWSFSNWTSSGLISEIDVTQNLALEVLWLDGNQITSLDVTKNAALKELWCHNSQITSLYLGSNPALEVLNVRNNLALEYLNFDNTLISEIDVTTNLALKSLSFADWSAPLGLVSNIDVSNNLALEFLGFDNASISNIDVSNNVALKHLTFSNWDEVGLISEIDVTQNLALEELWIDGNQITSLDVSMNPALIKLYCHNSHITSLYLGSNPALETLNALGNPNLAHLDIRNGNNVNVTTFSIGNTPNLTCINADGIDLPDISQAIKDSGKTFSEDCGDFVYIPDPNFEQALIDLGIDSDGVVNTSILRDDALEVTSLNLNNPLFDTSGFENTEIINITGKIADLTGIEAFINLTNLSVGYNALGTINVVENTKLEALFVNDNLLTGIDISSNTLLKRFGIMRNNIIGTVNVGSNNLLEELFIHETGISAIALNGNPNLTKLFINNNDLTSLDISTNQLINRVDAQYNVDLTLITDVAIGSSTLTSLNLSGTGLSSFNATMYPNLQWLLLNDNFLARFDAKKVLGITNLFLNNNQLTSLDLSSNPLLVQLKASGNQLTDLNLKNGTNTSLTSVDVSTNNLTCITADGDDILVEPYTSWLLDNGVQLNLDCKGAPEVVLIPDVNFELALTAFDTNGLNGNILLSEALAIINLDLSSASISDLTGIEAFENLLSLNVSNNNLTNTLDLTLNGKLETLDCSTNSISNLLISGSKGLTSLIVSSNNLTVIDLAQNGALISLNVANNSLQELTISATKSLMELDCSNNIISIINLTELTSLTSLDISSNSMTNIDAKDLDQLTSINVSSNLLVELDMRNGNNTAITSFDARNNLLTCIGVDDVQMAEDATLADIWYKGSANYTSSGDCLPPTVITQNISIEIDAKGVASISSSDIDNGSSDNSTPSKNLAFTLSQTEFDCSHLGENTVSLSVQDLEGNSSSQDAIVTVVDFIAPTAISIRTYSRDIFSALGTYIDAFEDLDDGSTDNCGIVSYALDQDTFTIPGTYAVNFTVEDAGGNTDTSQTTIEITDSGTTSSNLKFGGLALTVYPVPFSDVINISFSKPTDLTTVSVQLLYFDQSNTGINFYDNGGYLTSDDTSGLTLASGTIYWLQVTIGRTTKTIEIIKG